MSKKNTPSAEKSLHTTEDTGHSWDDGQLRELLNPPPALWLFLLYISVLFCLVYFMLYPSMPVEEAARLSVTGQTYVTELEEALDEIREKARPYDVALSAYTPQQMIDYTKGEPLDSTVYQQISNNEFNALPLPNDMREYVLESGKSLFSDRCAACHGNAGSGINNYPILVDDDWLYGGNINAIVTTLKKGRQGQMIAHPNISESELERLAHYVIGLSNGKPIDSDGYDLYTKHQCVSCHGDNGKGIAALGAANLTDKIWRFDAVLNENQTRLASVKHTIRYGVNQTHPKSRNAVMPAFEQQLTKNDIHKLALYVYFNAQQDSNAVP